MPTKVAPLLCELHAHSTWSDGWLPVRDLVDLYGRNGFDVLCVTDHTVRSDDPGLSSAQVPAQGGICSGGVVALVSDIYPQSDERLEYDAAQRVCKKRESSASWLFLLVILLVEAAWIGAIVIGIVWLTRLS